ncbi:hypothetical protein SDC9_134158 [bioreactor metagenome]|uniref:Uncharacterized protein n=1 Tax=bioreactor metagenome TaxID=1076179 RepID=A0A645DCZ1_9ZZZZ
MENTCPNTCKLANLTIGHRLDDLCLLNKAGIDTENSRNIGPVLIGLSLGSPGEDCSGDIRSTTAEGLHFPFTVTAIEAGNNVLGTLLQYFLEIGIGFLMHSSVVPDDNERVGIEEYPPKVGTNHAGGKILTAACGILGTMAGIDHLPDLFQDCHKGLCIHAKLCKDIGIANGDLLEQLTARLALLDECIAGIEHIGHFLIIAGPLSRGRYDDNLSLRVSINN